MVSVLFFFCPFLPCVYGLFVSVSDLVSRLCRQEVKFCLGPVSAFLFATLSICCYLCVAFFFSLSYLVHIHIYRYIYIYI